MYTLSVQIPDELAEYLKSLKDETGASLKFIVIKMIKDKMEKE